MEPVALIPHPEAETRLRSEKAALVRSNAGLRKDVAELQQGRLELLDLLQTLRVDSKAERSTYLAALNLMEDAIQARAVALASNAELRHKLEEQEKTESVLRQTQEQLQETIERYRVLTVELDSRVQERTHALADREERLQQLAAELKRVEQQERQRLARVLHDHIQQMLVSVKMRIDLLAAKLREPQKSKLQSVVEILGDVIDATRDLSVQLAPPLLHDQGLPAALDWLAARMTKLHGVQIQMEISAEVRPSHDDRDILFHAAQEFLLNAVKHAGSTLLSLKLSHTSDQIQLTVADQGVGFNLAVSAESRGYFGLFQLRQRLESNGGSLQIVTAAGKGTQVTASLPQRTAPSEESRPADYDHMAVIPSVS